MEALPGSSKAGNNVLADIVFILLNVILDCSVGLASRAVVFVGRFPPCGGFRYFRAEGGSVAIREIHVLRGYIGYYVPLVLQSQYVA